METTGAARFRLAGPETTGNTCAKVIRTSGHPVICYSLLGNAVPAVQTHGGMPESCPLSTLPLSAVAAAAAAVIFVVRMPETMMSARVKTKKAFRTRTRARKGSRVFGVLPLTSCWGQPNEVGGPLSSFFNKRLRVDT